MTSKIEQLKIGIDNFSNSTSIDLGNNISKYRSLKNYEITENIYIKDNRYQQTKALPEIGLPITLKNIFQHVRAGRATASLLNEIYIMPQGTESDDIDENTEHYIINANKTNVQKFISHIGQQVSNLRYTYIRSDNHLNSDLEDTSTEPHEYYSKANGRYVLVGKKGYGKTFFINYLLSCFADQLESEKIIWIRVDLTKPIRSWSVQDRLHHQAVKIVLEKYIRDNNRQQFSFEGFNSFLQKKYQDTNKVSNIIKSLEDITEIPDSYYEEFGRKNPISEGTLVKAKARANLFREIQAYCIDAGYGFFYVLDGLDRIVPSTYHDERYQQWLDEACELFYVSKNYCGVFLISLRDESYQDFLLKNSGIRGETLRRHPCVLRLAEVSPIDIYNRRFEKYHLFRETKIDPKVNLNALSKVTLKYIATSLDIEEGKALDYLLGLLSNDIRNVMLAIGLCLSNLIKNIVHDYNGGISHYEDKKTQIAIATENIIKFLDNSSEWGKFCRWKGYEAIECLFNGEQKNLHSPFLYETDTINSDLIRITLNPTNGIIGFFPNLFNFSYKIYKTVKGCKCPSLIKIYILIFLHETTCKKNGKRNIILLDEFTDEVQVEFGWPKELIRTALHELEYYGCIRTEKSENFVIIYETQVGIYCCTKLIYNHNYLTNCVYETYLPEFITETLDLPSIATTKHELAAVRIKNAIIFCKYLEKCEDFLLISTANEYSKITPKITANFFVGLDRIVSATIKEEGANKMHNALYQCFKKYMSEE